MTSCNLSVVGTIARTPLYKTAPFYFCHNILALCLLSSSTLSDFLEIVFVCQHDVKALMIQAVCRSATRRNLGTMAHVDGLVLDFFVVISFASFLRVTYLPSALIHPRPLLSPSLSLPLSLSLSLSLAKHSHPCAIRLPRRGRKQGS